MTADVTYYSGVVQNRQDGNEYVPSGKSINIESGGAFVIESGGQVSQPVDTLTATSTSPNHGYTVSSSSIAATITVQTPTRAGLFKTVVIYNSGATTVAQVVDFVVPVVGVSTVYTQHQATLLEDGSITVVSLSTSLWGLVSQNTSDSAISWSS